MNDLLHTLSSAPLQVILGAALLLAGPALIMAAFRLTSGPAVPAGASGPAADPVPEPVLSQVGFVEVDGRVLPFRALVRQSESLDDQQLAAFRRCMSAPPPSKFAA